MTDQPFDAQPQAHEAQPQAQWEFWIDRGGTFTDIVAKCPDGSLRTHKLLSSNPERYVDAAEQGIRDVMGLKGPARIPDGSIAAVKMGTTVATNALLERKGAPVVLLITQGFKDLLRIGYQTRPDLFALNIQRSDVLYQQVGEIGGRLDATGAEITPLDEQAARSALQRAYDTGLRSAAIAFMHAYLNPDHEARVAQIARDIGFTQVSTSSDVSRLAKLVSRADTTVVDAYLSPILRRYVDQVASALRLGQACDRLMFMQSNGGLTDAQNFQGRDAILSGPAGGIVGMVRTGAVAGCDRLIGFDMGGTSTDVSHYAGTFERSFETEVAGVRMRAPMMDIHTVAAGGGSICSFHDGRLQVGPQSAGADPGPAAYKRGGPLTVTDCNVFLGKLNPDHFPAVFGPNGDAPLDVDAATQAMLAVTHEINSVTEQTLTAVQVAQGFLRIAVDNMANAIKKISVERGHDVSQDYALQCFGGAGGQHACLVADALNMRRVLIHPFAGVLSAYGMGLAEVRALREAQADCALAACETLTPKLDALCDEARQEVRDQGLTSVTIIRHAHLRTKGSHQTLEVAWGTADAMGAAFQIVHKARFGFAPKGALIIDMLSVEAVGHTGETPHPAAMPAQAGTPKDQISVQAARWGVVPLYDRLTLAPQQSIKGPAIITEPTGTNVVEPDWTARMDAFGTLILTRDTAAVQTVPGSTDADPILLEVMSNLFMSVADQMGATLANTAWSVNIKERFDFSCAIFDAQGQLVANAPHVPVHLGSMSDSIQTVIALNPDVQDGDAFVLNSPYRGGTHLPDVTVVTPVFVGGVPAYWLGSRGHHADIGGRTPGSLPPDSTHIDDEGVLIDNMRLVTQGVFEDAAIRKVLSSAKYPARNLDQNIADLQAQVAANETGRGALLGIADRYGADVVTAYMAHVQDNAEMAVRAVIDGLKDGAFTYPMDDGSQIKVALRIDHTTRSATVDFTGTSAQHSGNFNAPLSISRAVVLYVFRCLVGKNIPLNEGCLRPIDLVIPQGSMLNPRAPAAVIAGNTEVSQAACNALFGALGVIAGSQGTMNNFVWGNETFQNYETIAGGTGAGPDFDGCGAVQSHMTNTRMTDPEILEARFPVRLEEFSIRRGSGGQGRHNGGDGAVRKLRFLTPVTVTTICSHRSVQPFGVGGADGGQVGLNYVVLPDGTRVDLRGHDEIDLPAQGVFVLETPGGGGFS